MISSIKLKTVDVTVGSLVGLSSFHVCFAMPPPIAHSIFSEQGNKAEKCVRVLAPVQPCWALRAGNAEPPSAV